MPVAASSQDRPTPQPSSHYPTGLQEEEVGLSALIQSRAGSQLGGAAATVAGSVGGFGRPGGRSGSGLGFQGALDQGLLCILICPFKSDILEQKKNINIPDQSQNYTYFEI